MKAPKGLENTSCQLPIVLVEAVKEIAAKEKRSKSMMIRILLEEAVADRQGRK